MRLTDITQKIAKLNLQILRTEVSKDTANDYRDQRNVLIDKLTSLVGAETLEMQDGQVDVTLGGYFLVTKGISKNLSAEESQAGGIFYVPKLEGTDVEVPVKSGIIRGLLEARGEVFASVGSIQNGTPNTKADITFAVDVSNTSASYIDSVKSNIASYVEELKKSGVTYNLHLITYGSNASASISFGTDDVALKNAIGTSNLGDTGNNFGGVGGVIDSLANTSDFMKNANRYAVVFTGESIEGDESGAVTDTTSYISRLNSLGIKTSVITDSTFFNSGFPGGEVGWDKITEATGGKLYDVASTDYAALMKTIASDTNDSVNQAVSTVNPSNNMISDLKKKLNALVNIIVREVNYLHKSGKTLSNPPLDGDDFFTVIDPSRPMEMGNIKLNDNLMSLNNIVASESGANGDNSIAIKMSNLRHQPLMTSAKGILSADDFYQQIILEVGNSGSDAQRIFENQQKLVNSADAYRQSITGVSMDEEMTNMMKFQYAYSASSRVINVVDEMIETIITRMGIAGR